MTTLDAKGLELVQKAQSQSVIIAGFFEAREFSKAMNEIRSLAEEANRYFDELAPWKTIDSEPEKTHQVLTSTLNVFRILAIYLKPVMPEYSEKVEALFQQKNYQWSDAQTILENHQLNSFEALITRIEKEKLDLIMSETKALNEVIKTEKAASLTAPVETKDSSTIDIEDFMKIDLRVAEIIKAEAIPEAEKLLRLEVNLGPMGTRQIIAGIKAAYDPSTLVGRLVIVVANLKPRKMKFGMSEGMVLAAGPGAPQLFVLSPDPGAKPGDPVK